MSKDIIFSTLIGGAKAKLMRRLNILAAIFAAIIFMCLLSIPASAASGEWVTVDGIVGGQICFDSSTGTITDCETTVTSANIPSQIGGVTVTAIGNYAFESIRSLINVSIGSTVTSIGNYAFTYCNSLTNFTVDANNEYYSNDTNGVLFNKDKTTLIQYPLGNTNTSYSIPSGVTSIEERAFEYSANLTSVSIPSSVTSIGAGAFRYCTKLTGFAVDANNKYYSNDTRGALFNKNKTTLIQYPIGNTNTSYTIPDNVTSIGQEAFYWCKLVNVSIPNSVTSISNEAFMSCSRLTSVYIPESVTSIGNQAFSYCHSIVFTIDANNNYYSSDDTGKVLFNKDKTTLIQYIEDSSTVSYSVPDSVTAIGNSAFDGCHYLTSVYIGDKVTSIGDMAFISNSKLTSVIIGTGVTYIGNQAFDYCYNLKNVYYTGTEAQWANISIDWCNNPLKNANRTYNYVYVPDEWVTVDGIVGGKIYFSSSTGTIIDCENAVTSAIIPEKIGGVKVAAIGERAFYGCTSLASVDIPDSVISIGDYAFFSCSLTSVSIPDSVTKIGDCAFYNCTDLTNVSLGNSVTFIGNDAFFWCAKLTNVSIPDSVTSIGDYAFFDCEGLTSMFIPDSVTSIGDCAFVYCFGITAFTVDANNNYYSNDTNGVLFNKDKTTLIQYPASNTNDSYSIPNGVTTISNRAFDCCSNLTSIFIPDSVTTIGEGVFNSCRLTSFEVDTNNKYFSNDSYGVLFNKEKTALLQYPRCSSNASYSIPDSVTFIGECAFEACFNLTGVTFGKSVISIGDSAFYNCQRFTSVFIPAGVTSIGDNTFYSCHELTKVFIPNSVTNIGKQAFCDCENLGNVYYEGTEAQWSAISIEYNNTSLTNANITYNYLPYENPNQWLSVDGIVGGKICFNKSTGTITYFESTITSANIPEEIDGVKVASIAYGAFNGCTNLTSVSIPDSVTSITGDAFSGCTSLTNVDIGDGVTTIGGYAFCDCTSLTSVDIGNSVTSIGHAAFYGCTSLTGIDIPGTVTSIGISVFSGCTSLTGFNVDANNNYYSNDTRGTLFNKAKTNLIRYPIGNVNTSYSIPDSVTSISDNAFNGSINLTSVTIPDTVTSIGSGAFAGCKRLTGFIVDTNSRYYSNDTSGVLFNKDKTTLIQYPAGNADTSYSIPYDVASIGASAFEACTSLCSVDFGDSITSIGDFAFYGCTGLTSVDISDSVSYISGYVFSNCTNLTSVTIGDNVTSIGNGAFEECKKLSYLYIPENVSSIGWNAFYHCSDLLNVYYENSEIYWSNIVIMPGNDSLENSHITYNYFLNKIEVTFCYAPGTDDPVVTLGTAHVKRGKLIDPAFAQFDGYTILGWYSNKNCSGTAWNFSTDRVKEEYAENSLTLWAKLKDDESFTQPNDVLPFTNSRSYFSSTNYEISDVDFELLLKNASSTEKTRLKNSRNNTWGGSCFGMSSVAVLMYDGLVNPSNYGANAINGLQIIKNVNGSADVGKVESLVNHYQLMQSIGNVSNARSQYNTNESVNLKSLITKLQSSNAVVLGLNLLNTSGKRVGGHAVVAYGMTANADSTKYTVKIYDCSISKDNPVYLTITRDKSTDTYSKECSAWEQAWGYSIFIKYALTSDVFTSMSFRLMDVEDPQYELTTNFDSFTISDGTSTVTVTDGEVVGEDSIGITHYGNQNEPGYDPSYKTILPALDTGSYVITPTEELESYEITLYCDSDDGFFHAIDTDKPVAVTINADGSLSTKGTVKAEQTITSAFNGSDMGADSVTITGSSTGFSVAPAAESTLMDADAPETGSGKVNISSRDNTEITLSLSSGLKDKEASGTIQLNEGSTITLEGVNSDDTGCKITSGEETVEIMSLGYVVVFDSCGGSTVQSCYVDCNTAATKPQDPTYDGYNFLGWYTDENLTTQWSFDDPITEDLLLYAGWERDPDYWKTVTFAAEGCSDQIITVASGTKLTEDDMPEDTTVDNINVKWNDDEISELLSSEITEDVTITGTVSPCGNDEALSLTEASISEGTASVKVTNKTAAKFTVKVFFAAYNSSGKMIGIRSINVEVDENSTTAATTDFTGLADIAKVKAFIFYDGFLPLGNCTEVSAA